MRIQKSTVQNQVKEYLLYPDEEEPFDRNKFLVSGTKFLEMTTGVNSIEITAQMELDPSLILRDEMDPFQLGIIFNSQIEWFVWSIVYVIDSMRDIQWHNHWKLLKRYRLVIQAEWSKRDQSLCNWYYSQFRYRLLLFNMGTRNQRSFCLSLKNCYSSMHTLNWTALAILPKINCAAKKFINIGL